MEDINFHISNIVQYAIQNKFLYSENKDYACNKIIELLKLKSFSWKKANGCFDNSLSFIVDFAIKSQIIKKSTTDIEIFSSRIINEIIGTPKEIIETFFSFNFNKEAMNWFYSLNKFTNYINEKKLNKNLSFTSYELEITINVNKPEILKPIAKKTKRYPSTPISKDNVGYLGGEHHPLRLIHRTIPLTLNNKKWNFQFSPYRYFNYHGILFTDNIIPMKIDYETIITLIDFVNMFPNFIAFSNTDKEGTGASILNHMHLQVGVKKFPFEKAKVNKLFSKDDVEFFDLEWYIRGMLLKSKNKDQLIKSGKLVIEKWKNFSTNNQFIKNIQNNTASLALRKEKDEYRLFILLRNNSKTNDKSKYAYSVPMHLEAIKKENVGIIEVAGLAILPGRLIEELALVQSNKNLTREWELWRKWVKDEIQIQDLNNKEKLLTISFKNILESINVLKEKKAREDFFKKVQNG